MTLNEVGHHGDSAGRAPDIGDVSEPIAKKRQKLKKMWQRMLHKTA
jgi:hypothetical protein